MRPGPRSRKELWRDGTRRAPSPGVLRGAPRDPTLPKTRDGNTRRTALPPSLRRREGGGRDARTWRFRDRGLREFPGAGAGGGAGIPRELVHG